MYLLWLYNFTIYTNNVDGNITLAFLPGNQMQSPQMQPPPQTEPLKTVEETLQMPQVQAHIFNGDLGRVVVAYLGISDHIHKP